MTGTVRTELALLFRQNWRPSDQDDKKYLNEISWKIIEFKLDNYENFN